LKGKELTHTELQDQLNKSLTGKFSGNISWYGETVELDLEARKIIERTESKRQKISAEIVKQLIELERMSVIESPGSRCFTRLV
jgi:uncharacterized protein DUF6958